MNAPLDPELFALKRKLHATWTAGEFDRIARSYETSAAEFVSRVGIAPGQRVLDVACGSGNLARPAARAGARVTGVDLAANAIAAGRVRAAEHGLEIEFLEGDCEDLPFPDRTFDVTLTMFGAMFAPRPAVVAFELARVCKPGGRLAMANWGRLGFVFEMFSLTASFAPPPPGMPSPVLWGEEPTLRERLGGAFRDVQVERRPIRFRFEMPVEKTVEHWIEYYGPLNRAAQSLDEARRHEFQKALVELWRKHNRGGGAATEVAAEYLEVRALRV
jgi:SAM-dependent methyltransferase